MPSFFSFFFPTKTLHRLVLFCCDKNFLIELLHFVIQFGGVGLLFQIFHCFQNGAVIPGDLAFVGMESLPEAFTKALMGNGCAAQVGYLIGGNQ